MSDESDRKMDELLGEVKSLHSRHDNHDQQLGLLHSKIERLRRMIVAALHFDGRAFMDAWRDP
jgi:hypothetical protein